MTSPSSVCTGIKSLGLSASIFCLTFAPLSQLDGAWRGEGGDGMMLRTDRPPWRTIRVQPKAVLLVLEL